MALCVAFDTQRETLFEVLKPDLDKMEKVQKKPLLIIIYIGGLLSGIIISVAINSVI
ncbi:MAG: CO dehydrogenase/acetyl-CoA synthase beta subunit [Glaciecola sp.]|jgi:CO dehydrogenase/acetyl-CoA synthase beta subunit